MAGDSQDRAFFRADWNFHFECLDALKLPFPAAFAARLFDDGPGTTACRAGGNVLNDHSAVFPAVDMLTGAVAGFAILRRSAGGSACSMAGLAGCRTSCLNGLFTAANNFFQWNLDRRFKVLAASRTAAPPAKKSVEEVLAEIKARPAKEFVEIDSGEQVLRRNTCASKTACIVSSSFVRIGENGVGLGDLLEALFGAGLLVAVGMVAKRKGAEGISDRFGIGVTRDRQDFIIIALLLRNGRKSYCFSRNSASTTRGPASVACACAPDADGPLGVAACDVCA